jgi:hypothetical protein
MSFFYLKDQFLASSNSFAIVKSNDSTGNLQKWLAKSPLRRLPKKIHKHMYYNKFALGCVLNNFDQMLKNYDFVPSESCVKIFFFTD